LEAYCKGGQDPPTPGCSATEEEEVMYMGRDIILGGAYLELVIKKKGT
jgi:hypothetical protein